MINFDRNLKIGSIGEDVAAMQEFLLQENKKAGKVLYDLGKPGKDNIYGEKTKNAWRQCEKNLKKQKIVELQEFLNAQDFNVGKVNGNMDWRTKRALKKFIKQNPNTAYPNINITVDGKASKAELRAYIAPQIKPSEIPPPKPQLQKNINHLTINTDAALDHLEKKALKKSNKDCAKYVRLALSAGGIEVKATKNAKNYGPKLEEAGFEPVAKCKKSTESEPYGIPDYTPVAGDVIVLQKVKHHLKCHMAMYSDDGKWISDFEQKSIFPSNHYIKYEAGCTVYRHEAFAEPTPITPEQPILVQNMQMKQDALLSPQTFNNLQADTEKSFSQIEFATNGTN